MFKTSNRYTIEIFESLESMPIKRYRLHNLYLLLDAAMGDFSTMKGNIKTGLAKLKPDPNSTRTILINMYSAIEIAEAGVSLESLAFASIVRRINGKPYSDVKEIVRVLELSGLTMGEMRTQLQAFKKKVENEFRILLPDEINDNLPTNVAKKLKEKAIHVLDQIIAEKEVDEELLAKIDRYLLSLVKPSLCVGAKGIEAKEKNQFEEACNYLELKGYTDPSNMMTFRFIKALKHDKDNRPVPRRK